MKMKFVENKTKLKFESYLPCPPSQIVFSQLDPVQERDLIVRTNDDFYTKIEVQIQILRIFFCQWFNFAKFYFDVIWLILLFK